MIKASALSVIILSFTFLVACGDGTPSAATATMNPTAQVLVMTLQYYDTTLDGIKGSATSYAYTPTLTPTPTNTPNRDAVNKQISNSINEQLISNFDANISVQDVKFGPIGGEVLTEFYVEINCTGNTSVNCPTNQVIVAVVTACKEKKKNVLANIPKSTEKLTITIFDSAGSQPRVVDIKWSDVMDFIDDKISGEDFRQRIRYVRLP